ncbi:MAG: hypothetical protein OEW84_01790 [Aigarchaeota archaeon]|nr:hypothetical protein [Aigarchaeota archaeon]
MSESRERTAERVKKKLTRAAAMLFFSRHRLPGVRGWELRKRLGRNYMKIVEMLNNRLQPIGMQVKVVFEQPQREDKIGEEDLERARFYITLAHPLSLSDVVGSGWRIDEVAALAAVISYVSSRGGKAPVNDVREMLQTKFPRWKAEAAIERFARRGYLHISEDDVVYVGWRTRAEVDQKELLKALMEIVPTESEESTAPGEEVSGGER